MAHHTGIQGELEDDQVLDFRSPGYNPRFPNTNITRYCWANFIEFNRCVAARGGDQNHVECNRFKNGFGALCPGTWRDNWEESEKASHFPGQEIWDPSKRPVAHGHH